MMNIQIKTLLENNEYYMMLKDKHYTQNIQSKLPQNDLHWFDYVNHFAPHPFKKQIVTGEKKW